MDDHELELNLRCPKFPTGTSEALRAGKVKGASVELLVKFRGNFRPGPCGGEFGAPGCICYFESLWDILQPLVLRRPWYKFEKLP